MKFPRAIIVLGTATIALAVPSAALAEPAVVAPAPSTLLTKPPTFTWTSPPNEALISITVGTDPTIQEDGLIKSTNGTYLSPDADTATSVTGRRVLAAGTYYWQTWWKTLTPYSNAKGAVNKLTIPPYVKAFKGTIQQYGSIPAVSVNGQYVTNIASNKVLCQIYRGKTVISKQTHVRRYNTIAGKNRFYCSDLKVSERLDGVKLRLKVSFISGGKPRAVAWKTFTAT